MTDVTAHRWSLSYDLITGGLVLKAVKHDGFRLAEDIRVTRVWVDTDLNSSSSSPNLRNFVLNSSELPAIREPRLILSSELQSPSRFFDMYRNMFGLEVLYASAEPYLKGTSNECDITVKQQYLFGDYGKDPPHEPGAVLDATRLFPLLSFSFPRVVDTLKPFPRYFRADYRLNIDLDNIDEEALRRGAPLSTPTVDNKAGIFRDHEDLPGLFGIGVTVARGLLDVRTLDQLFAAFEKPLKFEIASYGLVADVVHRRPLFPNPRHTWDNIHIWPSMRDASKPFASEAISTPGAFHALHCHWRWGAVAGDPEARGNLLPAAGNRSFTGFNQRLVGASRAGGSLVDTRVPEQNLQFAVTKNDAVEWTKERNPSEPDFRSLFTDRRRKPDLIERGGDLVLWMCWEAFRGDGRYVNSDPWEGTLFVNGIYFAHNKDKTPIAATAGGAYREGWNPEPKQQWGRYTR
jgi:hypothetical protein